MLVAAALAAAGAGCGGSGTPESPQDAARAWVQALDERDWERMCELSTPRRPECAEQVADSFAGWTEPRLERVITDEGSPRFEVSTEDERSEDFQILLERHDGGYLVHLDIAVIR